MTTTVFGKEYSSTYDILYQDKDYDKECDLIEQIIQNHYQSNPRTILDLGCGTGNHALRLARRGYSVTGVDQSREMLKIAREKSDDEHLNCSFINSSIQTFQSEHQYDIIIMMFAVLGYLSNNDDLVQALNTVRKSLKPGGLFICDVWYGPAVLHQKPGDRVRITEHGDERIIRTSQGILDSLHHIVTVKFRLITLVNDHLNRDISEEHQMRFFFFQELHILFNSCGLSIMKIRAFPDIQKEPSEDTWNVCLVSTPNSSDVKNDVKLVKKNKSKKYRSNKKRNESI